MLKHAAFHSYLKQMFQMSDFSWYTNLCAGCCNISVQIWMTTASSSHLELHMPSNLWQSHLTGQTIPQRMINLYPFKLDVRKKEQIAVEQRMTYILIVEIQGRLCTCKTITHLFLEWENWPKSMVHMFVVCHMRKPFSVFWTVDVLTWIHIPFVMGTPCLCTQHSATTQESSILSLGFLKCRKECWIVNQTTAGSQSGSACWMLHHLFPQVSWIFHRFNLTLCACHSTRFLVTQQG